MNTKNIPRKRGFRGRQITGISIEGAGVCSYCRTGCGDGTIRYKGIAICPDCFLRMAKLFFGKDFEFIENSGGQSFGFN